MKNLANLYVKKSKLYLLFILNKILLIIFNKKNQLYFYNIHIFVTYTKKVHFIKKKLKFIILL